MFSLGGGSWKKRAERFARREEEVSASMIRSERNGRSEFQRTPLAPTRCRANINVDVIAWKREGELAEVAAVETDVIYRRRYVFRTQSSEWNA